MSPADPADPPSAAWRTSRQRVGVRPSVGSALAVDRPPRKHYLLQAHNGAEVREQTTEIRAGAHRDVVLRFTLRRDDQ